MGTARNPESVFRKGLTSVHFRQGWQIESIAGREE